MIATFINKLALGCNKKEPKKQKFILYIYETDGIVYIIIHLLKNLNNKLNSETDVLQILPSNMKLSLINL